MRIAPDQWDGDNNPLYPIKGPGKQAKNQSIQQTRDKINNIVNKLQHAGIDPSVDEVKKLLIAVKQEKKNAK